MLIPVSEQQTLAAYWDIRNETPEQIAERYLTFFSRIKSIHQAFSNWIMAGLEHPVYWFEVEHHFVSCIKKRVTREDDGTPDPNAGYLISFLNSLNGSASSIDTTGRFSAKFDSGYIAFRSAWTNLPDPSIVNYRTWSAVFIALIECFDAEFGRAYPSSVVDLDEPQNRLFNLAWITYVPPDRARHVVPPATAVVTRLANGGMLLAAGDEIFDARNPEHLARARDILAALEPVQGPSLSTLYAYNWSTYKP